LIRLLANVEDELELSGLPHLQYLTIRQVTIQVFGWLISLLGTIPSDAEMLELELSLIQESDDFCKTQQCWPDCWSSLDNVLAEHQFQTLRNVKLSFYSQEGDDTPDESDLKLMMPQCGSRGILSVVDIIC
jgi:hypothetical protein